MTDQTPTVGRIVHYRSFGTPGGEYAPRCRAAIVTEVPTNDDLGITDAMLDDPETREMFTGAPVVSVAVVNPTGLFFDEHLPYDEDGERGGTWHWPTACPHGN